MNPRHFNVNKSEPHHDLDRFEIWEEELLVAHFEDTDGGRAAFEMFKLGVALTEGATLYDDDKGRWLVGQIGGRS